MKTDEQNAEQAASEVDAAPVGRVFPYKVTLKTPVTFGSTTIAELTFRKGRIADLRGIKLAKEVPMDILITIAARLSGQPTNIIELLDIDDGGQEAMDIAMDFFSRCLSAGK